MTNLKELWCKLRWGHLIKLGVLLMVVSIFMPLPLFVVLWILGCLLVLVGTILRIVN